MAQPFAVKQHEPRTTAVRPARCEGTGDAYPVHERRQKTTEERRIVAREPRDRSQELGAFLCRPLALPSQRPALPSSGYLSRRKKFEAPLDFIHQIVGNPVEGLATPQLVVKSLFEQFINDGLILLTARVQLGAQFVPESMRQLAELSHRVTKQIVGRCQIDLVQVFVRGDTVVRHRLHFFVFIIEIGKRRGELWTGAKDITEAETLVDVVQESLKHGGIVSISCSRTDCLRDALVQILPGLVVRNKGCRRPPRTILVQDDFGVVDRGLCGRRGGETLMGRIGTDELPHEGGFSGAGRAEEQYMPVAIGFSTGRERDGSVAESGEVERFPNHSVEEDFDHPSIEPLRGFCTSRRSVKRRVPENVVQLAT